MSQVCNLFYWTDKAIIGRRGNQNSLGIRIFIQSSFYLFHGKSCCQIPILQLLWIKTDRLQLQQGSGIIHRFVGISGNQYFPSSFYTGMNSCKNPCCTSIYQKKGFLRVIEPFCPVHTVQNQALRVMKVVKAINFCNIHLTGPL